MKKLFSALLCLALLFCITSCATTRGAADTSSIVGIWAYDYGYNQELWADDLITFNIDGTFVSHLVAPYYSEWDKGTWSLSTDAQGRQVLALHVTAYSNDNSTWNKVDITSYYYTDVLDDELVMNRFKRDRVQEDGWHPVEYYEPAIYNHYYRVKNGTKNQLIQDSWTVDKVRTHGCDWDETWTFNADGTMTSDWSDNGTEILTGTYDLKEKDGKTILHQQLSFNDGTTGEWWYEYSSCGPDLIRVALINSSSGGELDEPYVNYYYRDVPLVKYTYHWKTETQDYTFNDYWPKGREYTLLDSSKINYITNIPGQYLDQQILGCYDNENLSGSPLTSIRAADNTVDREFWINWAIKSHHNGSETEFCHSSAVPARDIFPDFSFKAGDTVTILFEADLSNDITGWSQIKFWNSQGMIGIGEREIHTQNRKLYAVYNVETSADSFDEILDFEYVYNKESGPVVFSNWKLAILDDSNSYKVDYHFGDLTYTELAYTGSDRTLPEDLMYFVNLNWELAQQEIAGWYENPSFTGTPVAAIPAGNRTDKSYYAKINLRPWKNEWIENGRPVHDYNAAVPAKVLVPGNSFNPKPGDTVFVYFSATLSHDLDGYAGLKLQGDRFFEQDWSYIKTENRKLSRTFKIKINSKAWIPSTANLSFDFGYSSDACDEFITFSDLEFVILDDSNSYNINYHIGNQVYTEKAWIGGNPLPTDMRYFENFNWDVGYHLTFVDWYTDASLSGNPVSSIAANSVKAGGTKDVYLKSIMKFDRWDGEGNDHGWGTGLPAKVLFSERDLQTILDSTGLVTFFLSAKSNEKLKIEDEHFSVELIDRSNNGWGRFTDKIFTYWQNEANEITALFTFEKDPAFKAHPSFDDLFTNFGYWYGSYDGEITFTDFKLILLDDKNSYDINYHIGNQVYTEKALSGVVKNLPTTMSYFGDFLQKPDFNLDWNLTFGGYTDNDGSLPASIAAGASKDVYLKILPRMHDGDAFFYSHLLGNVVLSETDINDLAGSTAPVTFRLTAKTAPTPSGQGSTLTIINYEHEEWDIQASANGTGFTTNADGSWSLTFNLAFADNVTQIQSNPDNILVSFDYNSEFYDGEITFTDFKLELVTD